MKKRYVACSLVLVMMVLMLTACGGNLNAPRNGTYVSEGLISQTWTFSGSNEIELSAVGGLVSTRGTWSIEGNRITIVTTLLGVETVQTNTITEITRNSFRVDGILFERQ